MFIQPKSIKCLHCKTELATYHPKEKLYEIEWLRGWEEFSCFLPVKIYCNCSPSLSIRVEKNQWHKDENIKCEKCNKTIANFSKPKGVGIIITKNSKSFMFGNCRTKCKKCNNQYDLELLRNEKKDLSYENELDLTGLA